MFHGGAEFIDNPMGQCMLLHNLGWNSIPKLAVAVRVMPSRLYSAPYFRPQTDGTLPHTLRHVQHAHSAARAVCWPEPSILSIPILHDFWQSPTLKAAIEVNVSLCLCTTHHFCTQVVQDLCNTCNKRHFQKGA